MNESQCSRVPLEKFTGPQYRNSPYFTELGGFLQRKQYLVRVVKSRGMKWAGHVARMGEGRGVHRVLVAKPEGKRPLGGTQT